MALSRPERARIGLALLALPAAVWTIDLLLATPLLILAASSVPVVLVGSAIAAAQRGGGRSRASLACAALWGSAGAAFLATTGNELARAWLRDAGGGRAVAAVAIAPVVEESTKALGLALLAVAAPRWLRNPRDGIVLGALAGVGFVWTENFLYLGVSMLQGGEEGLVRTMLVRGVLGGATHAVFTGCAGAVIGGQAAGIVARTLAGLAIAAAQHAAWNGLAAPAIATALCGATAGACVPEPPLPAILRAAILALLLLLPGIVFLAITWRRNGNNTRREELAEP